MKREAILSHMICNRQDVRVEEEKLFEKINIPPIYEVIRVIDGVALFLEEHLDRMYKSAEIVDYKIKMAYEDIIDDIYRLIKLNEVKDLNVKILIYTIDGVENVLLYFIKSFYPSVDYYEDGIKTVLYNYERTNPNAKVLYSDYKEKIANLLEEKEAFEAILVNDDKTISEGSRSNMFFILGGKVYTAKGKDVLLGITRKHIVDICLENGIDLVEEAIDIDDIGKISGAIMTGTSVNALPIQKIDNYEINTVKDQIYREINELYLLKINSYIENIKDTRII